MRTHPKRIRPWFVAQAFCAAGLLLAQGAYKVDQAGTPPPDLPKALRDALQPGGARLMNDQGVAVAELWLCKAVPTQQAGAKPADVAYPSLVVGTVVGVIHFESASSDFRGQPIKPGSYTLRYTQIPQDGNHMGVSSYRDFLLLGPVAQDADIDKALSFEAMVKLSRQASGTGHPAVLSLIPPGDAKPPAVAQDDQGHWLLQVEVPGKSSGGEQGFPMAAILVGKTEAG